MLENQNNRAKKLTEYNAVYIREHQTTKEKQIAYM
jgi:hypothetical protein